MTNLLLYLATNLFLIFSITLIDYRDYKKNRTPEPTEGNINFDHFIEGEFNGLRYITCFLIGSAIIFLALGL